MRHSVFWLLMIEPTSVPRKAMTAMNISAISSYMFVYTTLKVLLSTT